MPTIAHVQPHVGSQTFPHTGEGKAPYAISLPLDLVANAVAGWAPLQLRTAFTTEVVQARRGGDNALDTFFPDTAANGYLTDDGDGGTDIVTWAAGGDTNAYVRTLYDQTGNGHDAVQTVNAAQPQIVNAGTLNLSAGNSTPYLEFDGVDDSLLVADHADFTFGDGASADSAFSLTSSVYPTSSGSGILGKGDLLTNMEWIWYWSNSDLNRFHCVDAAWTGGRINCVSDSSSALNAWYNFVATYDGSESESGMKIYDSGSVVASTNSSNGTYGAMHDTSNQVSIGVVLKDDATTKTFTGRLTSAIIYNRELTSAEASTLHNSPTSPT